jgi:macrolide transport system ATP-binding/permease protein
MITTLLQDVRYAIRQLVKTPGFTTTAVLTLALGIGANAAIFALVNAVLMKNLPVADPKTLVRIGDDADCCVNGGTRDDGDYTLFSTATWEYLKKNTPEFEELAAMQAGYAYRPIVVRRDGDNSGARSHMGEFVSGNYFRTFGLSPHSGRLITNSDDLAGAPHTAVMSYSAWKSDYAGDSSVIGSTFWINTKPVTIIGIAPPGFFGDRLSSKPPEFYLPIESMPGLANAPYVHNADSNWLYLVGRIKPGVSLPALQDKVTAFIRQSFAQTNTFSSAEGKVALAKAHVVLTPGGAGIQDLRDQYGSNLRLLMVISGLVLLIACANIANLLLVRGMARKAEMSVRTALGAARSRIMRQLLTESIVLAGLSGLVGLIVAYAGTRMLLALAFPGVQNLPVQASPSLPVLAFASGLSLLTGVLFGVAPAWIAAQAEPAEALRTGSRSSTGGASLLQRSLVVLQAALSLVLLVGAGLFSRSLNKLQNTDMKLDSRNRYIVHINPQAAGYAQSQLEALYRTTEERFHALPGIVNVGISMYTPMEDNNWGEGVQVQGQPSLNSGASWVKANAEYFDSVGTRVIMGRGISARDSSAAPTVAVVNEAFVKKFFNGANPIGQHFGSPGPDSTSDYEIVGVVEDTTYTTVRWKDHRMYFVPIMQRPARQKNPPIEKDESFYAGTMVLQTERPVPNMEVLARQTLAGINPNLTVIKFQTFDQQIADRFVDDRMIARLTMLFGVLALLLATVGLYGVTAYTVARRTSEIGIRMALGADRGGVVAAVLRSALSQTALGLAIGVPVALLCVRFVQAQLYEIKGLDSTVLVVSLLTLLSAATLAGLIPARRASSIDPARALRID